MGKEKIQALYGDEIEKLKKELQKKTDELKQQRNMNSIEVHVKQKVMLRVQREVVEQHIKLKELKKEIEEQREYRAEIEKCIQKGLEMDTSKLF
jgi:hypothetical protein